MKKKTPLGKIEKPNKLGDNLIFVPFLIHQCALYHYHFYSLLPHISLVRLFILLRMSICCVYLVFSQQYKTMIKKSQFKTKEKSVKFCEL